MIGVEAEDAACMTAALNEGRPVLLPSVGGFADGAAVKLAGAETFRVCNEHVDEMITVTNDEICAAIKSTFEDTRSVLEPAGALGLAGLLKYSRREKCKNKTFVAIASGANMDFDRLRFVTARSESQEALLAVVIPERPGAFRELYSTIFPRRITEFSYRMSSGVAKDAHIFLSYKSESEEDKKGVVQALEQKGFPVFDISNDETAKEHVRHMSGGRSGVKDELLYRFQFPERPDELKRFLDSLISEWNVSLWHYRYSGGVTGSVLVGVQVPPETTEEFQKFLKTLGFSYSNETDNFVYKTFLKHEIAV
jgi:threonine dehydratase